MGNQAYVVLSAAAHEVALHAVAPLSGLAVADEATVHGLEVGGVRYGTKGSSARTTRRE